MKFTGTALFCIVLLAEYNLEAFSQVKVTGQLADQSSGENLENVYVLNLRVPGGTVTDSIGNFSIIANLADTLIFRLLGYKERKIPVPEILRATAENRKITLDISPFLIDEVKIESPGFKINIYGITTPKGPRHRNWVFINSQGITLPNPLTVLYYKFSKSEKEIRLLDMAPYEEKKWQFLSNNYNKEVIKKITLLTGDSLDNFMVYCNAFSGLKSNATNYDVEKRVRDLFIEYKKTHP
jgi:hypothetical protein